MIISSSNESPDFSPLCDPTGMELFPYPELVLECRRDDKLVLDIFC